MQRQLVFEGGACLVHGRPCLDLALLGCQVGPVLTYVIQTVRMSALRDGCHVDPVLGTLGGEQLLLRESVEEG